MWIGSLALAGVPFFAGYYSKDIILEAAYGAHTSVGQFAWVLGIIAALMTAFYSWRLLILTFHGKTRADHHAYDHAHESPPSMMVPLIVLAVGAVFSGWYAADWFVGEGREVFWHHALVASSLGEEGAIAKAHHVEGLVKHLPTLVGLLGILSAFVVYLVKPGSAEKIAAAFKPLHQLFFRKWYFDEIYDAVFVQPSFKLGRFFWKQGDGAVIDAYGPDGVSSFTACMSAYLRRLQTGYVYHYAFAMVIALVAAVIWLQRG